MRFRRWPRPTAYRETPRKRAAFLRKQHLEREALPLFADAIAARQHGVDEEMARRHVWWDEREHGQRDARASRCHAAARACTALACRGRLWRVCFRFERTEPRGSAGRSGPRDCRVGLPRLALVAVVASALPRSAADPL